MTEQNNAAAERSAHVERGAARRIPGESFLVETSPGVFQIKAVAEAIRERDEARAALREARREGIEAAAKEVDCGCDIRDAVLERLESKGQKYAGYLCPHGDVCCALQAAEIRTLKWEGGR